MSRPEWIAKIIREEWNADREELDDFCVRRFPNDTIANLKAALAILISDAEGGPP